MKAGWQTKQIDELCNVEYGTRVVHKRDGGSVYSVYGGGGATFHMDEFNREDRLVIARFAMSERCTRFVEGKFFLNDSGLTLSPKNGALLPRFLDYQLLSLNDTIYSLAKGAAQKNLDVPAFRCVPLSFPADSAEQERIIDILDNAIGRIATAKANTEKNLRNAQDLCSSYRESVRKASDAQWIETTLGSEVDLLPGFAFKSAQYTDADEDIRLLRGDNIIPGALRWEDVKRWPKSDASGYRRYDLHEGDVVLAMDRPWVKAGLKHALILKTDLPCLLVQRVARLRVGARLDNRFLMHLIRSAEFTRHILGMQTGIGVPHISGQQIQDFRFLMPSVENQRRFVEQLDELNDETNHLESIYQKKIAAFDALEKSLLHHAFTGAL